jgi:hypothetical protein
MTRPLSDLSVGAEVDLIHAPGLRGVVSSISRDEVMLCMPIGLTYQLRGPFAPEDLRLRAETSPRRALADHAGGERAA